LNNFEEEINFRYLNLRATGFNFWNNIRGDIKKKCIFTVLMAVYILKAKLLS